MSSTAFRGVLILVLALGFGAMWVAPASATSYSVGAPAFLCTSAGTGPGQCSASNAGLKGVAVDQSTGDVFVVDPVGARIAKFTPAGGFERAFGSGVVDGVTPGPAVCTTTCAKGLVTGAGAIPTNTRGIAVDPSDHTVYVVGGTKITYFNGTTGAYLGEFTSTSAVPPPPAPFSAPTGLAVDTSGAQHYLYLAMGTGATSVINKFKVPSGATPAAYVCQITGRSVPSATECHTTSGVPSASQDGVFNGLDFTNQKGGTLAVDNTGSLYIAENYTRNTVSKYDSSGTFVRQYTLTGPAAVALGPPNRLFVAVGDSGAGIGGTRVVEIDTADPAVYPAAPTLLSDFGAGTLDHTWGIAVVDNSALSNDEHVYVSDYNPAKVWNFTPPPPPPTAAISPADAGVMTATLHGTVTIPSPGIATSYHFEYSANGVNWTSTPETSAGSTTGPHSVQASVSGLTPSTLYAVRLVATTGTPATSATGSFTTAGAKPSVSQEAVTVDDQAGTLSALVNPQNQSTRYRFEWGLTAAYGNRVPAFDREIGSGSQAVAAQDPIAGLQPDTTYHFRIVAKNATGTTTGDDHTFTTDKNPGQPGNRVPEMISPADKETGAVRGFNGAPPIEYVVAPDGNSVVYMMTRGLVDALIPDQPMYLGTRSSGGWQSEELIPTGPFTPSPDHNGLGSQINWVADDLSCSIIRSAVPLTDDAPEAVRNNNGGYLFRRDANGDITLLTPLVPTNPGSLDHGGVEFEIASASQDCRHVVFSTPYRYAGMGESGIYRSDDGVITELGILPGGALRTSLTAAGIGNNPWNIAGGGMKNAVSRDTSRVFFTDAVAGIDTLFVREGSTTTRVSASKTGTPAGHATFELASVTGDKVIFLANYGLTPTSSVAGPQANCSIVQLEQQSPLRPCALYLYDVVSDTLTDISADLNPADTNGAMAAGVVAASDDLSRIYFVAQGQVGGEGRTYNANVAAGKVNLFLWDATGGSPSVRFIAGLTTDSLRKSGPPGRLLVHSHVGGQWMSDATPDGDALVFQAAGDVVGYDSGPFPQAYHYSAQTGELACVSCRRDGEPSLGPDPSTAGGAKWPILSSSSRTGRQMVQLTDDGQRVFFMSRDVLADGAVADNQNIYEWDRGVVRLLVTGSRAIDADYNKVFPEFVGASSDGRDVFVRTTSSLVSRDTDGELDLYDLRVGGGFPEPDPPPVPCAALEGACQGGGSEAVLTDTKTLSSSGDGNASGEGRATLSLRLPSARARAEAALSGRLRLSVETSSAGRLSLVAKAKLGKHVRRVATVSKQVRRAGVTRVDLRLSRAAKRRLGSGKRLRLMVEVRQSGARPRTVTVTLKRGKRS